MLSYRLSRISMIINSYGNYNLHSFKFRPAGVSMYIYIRLVDFCMCACLPVSACLSNNTTRFSYEQRKTKESTTSKQWRFMCERINTEENSKCTYSNAHFPTHLCISRHSHSKVHSPGFCCFCFNASICCCICLFVSHYIFFLFIHAFSFFDSLVSLIRVVVTFLFFAVSCICISYFVSV